MDELLGHRPLRHVKPGPTPRLQKIMEQISMIYHPASRPQRGRDIRQKASEKGKE